MALLDHKVVMETPDDPVFLVVECPGRPTISIDITNEHGRRGMGVRIDGMGIVSFLVDVKELGTTKYTGKAIQRFCPLCGYKLKLFSSRPHVCEEESQPGEAEQKLVHETLRALLYRIGESYQGSGFNGPKVHYVWGDGAIEILQEFARECQRLSANAL